MQTQTLPETQLAWVRVKQFPLFCFTQADPMRWENGSGSFPESEVWLGLCLRLACVRIVGKGVSVPYSLPSCLAVTDSKFPWAKSCLSLVLVSINFRGYFLPPLPFCPSKKQQTPLFLALFGRHGQFSKYKMCWWAVPKSNCVAKINIGRMRILHVRCGAGWWANQTGELSCGKRYVH